MLVANSISTSHRTASVDCSLVFLLGFQALSESKMLKRKGSLYLPTAGSLQGLQGRLVSMMYLPCRSELWPASDAQERPDSSSRKTGQAHIWHTLLTITENPLASGPCLPPVHLHFHKWPVAEAGRQPTLHQVPASTVSFSFCNMAYFWPSS